MYWSIFMILRRNFFFFLIEKHSAAVATGTKFLPSYTQEASFTVLLLAMAHIM